MSTPLRAEAGSLKRQLADAHSVDSSDLQRRLKDVTDMLYLKQTQVGWCSFSVLAASCWGMGMITMACSA